MTKLFSNVVPCAARRALTFGMCATDAASWSSVSMTTMFGPVGFFLARGAERPQPAARSAEPRTSASRIRVRATGSTVPTGRRAVHHRQDTAMRIAFVARRWWPAMGGGETFARHLARGLAEVHEVTVLAHRVDHGPTTRLTDSLRQPPSFKPFDDGAVRVVPMRIPPARQAALAPLVAHVTPGLRRYAYGRTRAAAGRLYARVVGPVIARARLGRGRGAHVGIGPRRRGERARRPCGRQARGPHSPGARGPVGRRRRVGRRLPWRRTRSSRC